MGESQVSPGRDENERAAPASEEKPNEENKGEEEIGEPTTQ